jgi:hypothetical protein
MPVAPGKSLRIPDEFWSPLLLQSSATDANSQAHGCCGSQEEWTPSRPVRRRTQQGKTLRKAVFPGQYLGLRWLGSRQDSLCVQQREEGGPGTAFRHCVEKSDTRVTPVRFGGVIDYGESGSYASDAVIFVPRRDGDRHKYF